MTATMDKAKISGIVGSLGAIAAVVAGYANFFMLAGFGMFFFTLLIQYGSFKFKIITSAAVLTGLSYFFFGGGSMP